MARVPYHKRVQLTPHIPEPVLENGETLPKGRNNCDELNDILENIGKARTNIKAALERDNQQPCLTRLEREHIRMLFDQADFVQELVREAKDKAYEIVGIVPHSRLHQVHKS